MKDVGTIAFLIGIFGSLLIGILGGFGLFTAGPVVTLILVVSGLIIGLLHIRKENIQLFMIISLVLGVGSAGLAALPVFGVVINSMLVSLASVTIPAGIIVAFKALLKMK